MNLNEKPRNWDERLDVHSISRAMLVLVNTFPDTPVGTIDYDHLHIRIGEETTITLSTIQGAYINKRYICGGYEAEYQFKLIYRIKPGESNHARLSADELLNRFGDWARGQKPELGDHIRAIRIEPTTQSSKFAAYPDGYEDYQILMKLTYEVNV